MKSIIALVRVSTQGQASVGGGFVRQEASISEYAKLNSFKIIEIVREIASGALPLAERPSLATAIALARQTGATIVVESMSRLARNAHIIDQIYKESGVVIDVIEMLVETDERRRNALARGAEVEHRFIISRTALGREKAREKGVSFGSGDPCKGGRIRGAQIAAEANLFAASTLSIINSILVPERQISLRRLATKLNELDVRAPRGGRWSAKQVSRLLKRLRSPATSDPSLHEFRVRPEAAQPPAILD